MLHTDRNSRTAGTFLLLLLFVFLSATLSAPMSAQQPGETVFASPEEASSAFYDASRSASDNALLAILGPAGKDVISSGDATEDAEARARFVSKYEQMHRFAKQRNGSLLLVVGAENWPLPIPLVHGTAGWYFDTPAGKDEILFRRIGQNETAAILACGELVDAQKQYFANSTGGSIKQYAQKLLSDPGTRNGLYWEKTAKSPASPFNPQIAHASGSAPAAGSTARSPFYGYFFRVLAQQGPQAPGGAKNYVVDGKMTQGFAFVAYPVEYRSSGVMTFTVNDAGLVYEKDLGPDTAKLAEATTTFNPDSTWRQVN